jgi:CubicO group peptidase (beta-lactamase class C family)
VNDHRPSRTYPVARLGLLPAALAIILAGCSRPPSTVDHRSLDGRMFRSTVDSLRQAAHIPGLAMAVVQDTTILFTQEFGFADVEAGRPVTIDTPFNIASVTKPISAVVALKLVELGRLDLDRPMSSFRDFNAFCADTKGAESIFFRDFHCDDGTMTLRHVLSMEVNGTPGTRFFYNPVVYSWASRPMMEVSGRTFSDLVREYVFEPAGMHESARTNRNLPLRAALAARLALPYHVDDSLGVVRSDLPGPQGDGAAGGVIATARDLALFDIALTQGRLIGHASRNVMWTAGRSPSGETLPYGIGWFVTTIDGEPVYWHTGLWEGAYSALYLRFPARRMSLVLLANSDGLRWDNALDEANLERSPFARAFRNWIGAPRRP